MYIYIYIYIYMCVCVCVWIERGEGHIVKIDNYIHVDTLGVACKIRLRNILV